MTRTKARDGQGTVKPRKLASGSVVHDAWAPPMVNPLNGKRDRPSKRGFKSEREARAWIARQIADNENGVKAVEKRGGKTFRNCMDGWYETSPLKASSKATYRQDMRRLGKAILDQPIAKLTRNDIDRIIAGHHAAGAGINNLCRFTIGLGHVWEYAITDGAASTNALTGSPWPKALRRDARNRKAERDEEREEAGMEIVLTPEQVRTLVETERRPALAVLWEFLVSTGLRRAEALALRWSDIDLDAQTMWVRANIADIDGEMIQLDTPKGNKRRKIHLDINTVTLLRRHKVMQEAAKERADLWEDHGLVFPVTEVGRTGQRFPPGHWMPPSAVTEAFGRRAKRLGFGTTKLHSLRFTWASTAFAAGVKVKVIQDHLGHAFDITTLVYVKVDQATKREAVTRVVDHLRGVA